MTLRSALGRRCVTYLGAIPANLARSRPILADLGVSRRYGQLEWAPWLTVAEEDGGSFADETHERSGADAQVAGDGGQTMPS